MIKLISKESPPPYGYHTSPVGEINFMDFELKTAFGRKRSNLFKRLKFNRFNFVGFLADEFMAGVAVVDLGLIKNGFAYHLNRSTGEITESSVLTPVSASIRPTPDDPLSQVNLPGFAISISKHGVRCKTRKLSLEAQYTQAHPHPMRVLSRTGYRGWTYTDKRSPISLSGTLHVGEKRQTLSSPETLAFTDWSAGYMRRETFWSWAASAATLSDGTPFGMNLAAGVNETGFTENMIWLGEKPIHVGPVHFDYIQGDNQSPWRITSMDGIVDLTYTPEGFRDEKINAFVFGSLFTQLCGTFTGTITPPGEPPVTVTRAPGFCEDHFARW